MFSDKIRNVNGLKTLILKLTTLAVLIDFHVVSACDGPNMHCSRRSYFIILMTEVRDYVYTSCNLAFFAASLWFSFLDKCKTFNVVDVGRRRSKHISSMVNLIVAKHIYVTSELCLSSIPKNIYLPVQ